jgi:hypothetical protein
MKKACGFKNLILWGRLKAKKEPEDAFLGVNRSPLAGVDQNIYKKVQEPSTLQKVVLVVKSVPFNPFRGVELFLG